MIERRVTEFILYIEDLVDSRSGLWRWKRLALISENVRSDGITNGLSITRSTLRIFQ